MGNFFSIFCSESPKVKENLVTSDINIINNDVTNKKPKKKEQVDDSLLPAVTRDDVMIMNMKDKKIIRLPKSIRGNEFIIDNCENCDILVCDYTAQITVDNCKNCRFFFGPCEASAFFRDCIDCKLVVACQQLRLRDCINLDIELFCVTQPVIEKSHSLRLGSFRGSFFTLSEMFAKLNFSIWTNEFFAVHDFTPDANTHWSYLPPDQIILPKLNELSDSFSSEECSLPCVPYSLGLNPNFPANAFILITKKIQFDNLGWKILEHSKLRRSKESNLTNDQNVKLLSQLDGNKTDITTSVVGLELIVTDRIKLDELLKESSDLLYTYDKYENASNMYFNEFRQNVF